MPIITGIKRKSPLDLNNNIRIGVAFPLDENNMFKGTETVMEQAKSNLINVLLTYPGERVNLPKFGVGLKNLLFEQKIDIITLRENIIKQAAYYVANIQVIDVRTSLNNTQSTLFVAVTFRSLLDGRTDAVQLNFNN